MLQSKHCNTNQFSQSCLRKHKIHSEPQLFEEQCVFLKSYHWKTSREHSRPAKKNEFYTVNQRIISIGKGSKVMFLRPVQQWQQLPHLHVPLGKEAAICCQFVGLRQFHNSLLQWPDLWIHCIDHLKHSNEPLRLHNTSGYKNKVYKKGWTFSSNKKS